ncbi:MAG: IclR family transcriptional regulator, partial [Pseudonocardiaceae bacterium]
MNAIQLLKKASQVVDDLARLGPSTPAELAKATGEPRPTIYRIVAALEEIEVIRSAGEGRFELGPALLKLGDAAVDAFVDRADLHKQLRWARGQLGMNTYFCVLREDRALCLDHVDGTDIEMLGLGPGRTLPLHAGAASHALLAFASPEVRSAVLKSDPFERLASGTPESAPVLQQRLDHVLEHGWSLDDSEVLEGVASIAVPVRRPDGTVIGVVTIAG